MIGLYDRYTVCASKSGDFAERGRTILDTIQTAPESRREWMLERFKLATKTHKRNKNYQFWQYGNHAEEIYSHKFMWSKLDYIHLNPVRSHIVSKASDYVYSSASNYVNNEGIVKVTLVSNAIVDVLKPISLTLACGGEGPG